MVPNHMAMPVPGVAQPAALVGAPRRAGSPFAHWFDVDWAAQDGRLLLPILAGPLEDCLGDLHHRRPAPPEPGERRRAASRCCATSTTCSRSGPAPPSCRWRDLLGAQHYRLADWRDAATELNWRRFFDITSLIAVRVEDPDVFDATHRVLLRLVREGLIDGLRVDHPDGLADPRGYLTRLAARDRRRLGGGGEDPGARRGTAADWACAGTTGYDALAAVGGLFMDPAGDAPLTDEYVALHRRQAELRRRWPGRQARRSRTARSPPRWPG